MGQGLSVEEKAQKKMSAKSFVDVQLKDGKVVVFSKSYCPYCKKAKQVRNGCLVCACLSHVPMPDLGGICL